jgi:hypothetical protein
LASVIAADAEPAVFIGADRHLPARFGKWLIGIVPQELGGAFEDADAIAVGVGIGLDIEAGDDAALYRWSRSPTSAPCWINWSEVGSALRSLC